MPCPSKGNAFGAGTVRLVALALWAAPLASLAACALAAAATYATGDPSYARQHALGFSGVVFALCVAEVGRSPNAKRSIFGVVEVPARLSPWALLLAMQLLVPNASFVGHLGGLATGSLEAGGYMTWLLPPAAGLDARLAGLPGYAVAGDENVRAASGLGDLLRFARHVVTFLAGLVGLDRCTAAARRRFGECWAHAAEKPPELAKAAVGATADV